MDGFLALESVRNFLGSSVFRGGLQLRGTWLDREWGGEKKQQIAGTVYGSILDSEPSEAISLQFEVEEEAEAESADQAVREDIHEPPTPTESIEAFYARQEEAPSPPFLTARQRDIHVPPANAGLSESHIAAGHERVHGS